MTGNERSARVRVDLVAVDGAEGQALEERQLAVIREVLLWARRDAASTPEAPTSAAETADRPAAR